MYIAMYFHWQAVNAHEKQTSYRYSIWRNMLFVVKLAWDLRWPIYRQLVCGTLAEKGANELVYQVIKRETMHVF